MSHPTYRKRAFESNKLVTRLFQNLAEGKSNKTCILINHLSRLCLTPVRLTDRAPEKDGSRRLTLTSVYLYKDASLRRQNDYAGCEHNMAEQKQKPLRTLILAAGKGTRMGSDLAKVLHRIHGRPLLDYVIEVAEAAGSEENVIIVGHQADLVRETFAGRGLVFVDQREQLGTGHAVLQAREAFTGYQGDVLILCGDVPLLPLATVKRFCAEHTDAGVLVSVLTAQVENPRGYGRIVKDEQGMLKKIVEERDASEAERAIHEINSGIYLASAPFLFDAVQRITNHNNQREYYLTDIVEIANRKGFSVHACLAEDARSVMGINTPEELKQAEKYRDVLKGQASS